MFPRLNEDDLIQKTWTPEGTYEYRAFKQLTRENTYLSNFLKQRFKPGPSDLVLDVGGRDGEIAFALQRPESVHIVDPDPTIELVSKPGKFIKNRIQDIDLSDQYRLIICSHVLGYLGKQNAQFITIKKLLNSLSLDGCVVLFYNRNTKYMNYLLNKSKHILDNGHHDYFDESILYEMSTEEYKIEEHDVWFKAEYGGFDELARCCWFLFGALNEDIEGTAAKFIPVLRRDLASPTLPIEQRIVCITRAG